MKRRNGISSRNKKDKKMKVISVCSDKAVAIKAETQVNPKLTKVKRPNFPC